MNGNSNCCGATTNPCDSTIAELPRYYPRQLITPDDLTLEQNYFRDRMRRHNRLLHGWGVVCGALVCPATTTNSDGSVSFTAWQVQVQTGYLLGPYGDEIILDCVRTVDLRTSGVTGVTGEPCVDAPDPWCSQVFTTPSTTSTLFIAIKYKQSMMRPVRVQPVGCGCDDTSCEYSRLHDGYEIGVLTTCPTCNACDKNVLPAPQPQSLITGAIPSCPDCSCGPWVCLAQVTLSADATLPNGFPLFPGLVRHRFPGPFVAIMPRRPLRAIRDHQHLAVVLSPQADARLIRPVATAQPVILVSHDAVILGHQLGLGYPGLQVRPVPGCHYAATAVGGHCDDRVAFPFTPLPAVQVLSLDAGLPLSDAEPCGEQKSHGTMLTLQ